MSVTQELDYTCNSIDESCSTLSTVVCGDIALSINIHTIECKMYKLFFLICSIIFTHHTFSYLAKLFSHIIHFFYFSFV